MQKRNEMQSAALSLVSSNITNLRPKSGNFLIRKIDSLDGLLSIEQSWRELEQPITLSNLGSTFTVVRTAWETLATHADTIFGYDKKLLVLEVSENGKPIAIVPLVNVARDRKFGPLTKRVRCIEFLAQSTLGRHFRFFSDIITNQPSNALSRAVFDWLNKNEHFDVLHLAFISELSPNWGCFKNELFYALVTSTVDVSAFTNFDNYARLVYSTSLKQNIRTAYNRAAAESVDLSVTVEEADTASMLEVMDVARTKLDIVSFFGGGYTDFLTKLCLRQQADIVTVRANGRPIAYRVYLKLPGSRFAIDTHRNFEYRRLELGALLMDKAIRNSFEQRVNQHCEGLFGGLHTERFATNLIKGYKFIGPGTTMLGKPTAFMVRHSHQVEDRHLNRNFPIVGVSKSSEEN
jgi:hypothetical protein